MGTNLASHTSADEEYIDIELTREFEFQMFSTCTHKETTADELFYNGKLLPLPLHLRRAAASALQDHHHYSLPFLTCSTAPCTKTTNMPLHSCHISPSESCRVSCELNPNNTLLEWSNELSSFTKNHQKRAWPKKLKQRLIKPSIFVQKLKSSKAYLKSFFTKSASDESSADNYLKIGKKIAAIVNNIDRELGTDEYGHRRSFSGANKRRSPTKCLSSSSSNSSFSSSSFNSNGVDELGRSSSATEIEVSIDAAIAHCKKSMQNFQTREPGL